MNIKNILFNRIFIKLWFVLFLVLLILLPFVAKGALANFPGQTKTFSSTPANYDPDPNYGTKQYWDTWWQEYHPGEEKNYLPKQMSAGQTLNAGYYFISKDGVTVSKPSQGVPGIKINGEVYFIFEDGAVLNVEGGDGKDATLSAPAIEVPEYSTFVCSGKGTVNAKGPSHTFTDQYVIDNMQGFGHTAHPSGKYCPLHWFQDGEFIYGGYGGEGGAGGAGLAAIIGSAGGAGGDKTLRNGYNTKSKPPRRATYNSNDESGLKGLKGNDGKASATTGNFGFEGCLTFNLTQGNYVINEQYKTAGIKGGDCCPGKKEYVYLPDRYSPRYLYDGYGGAGGAGNIGFLGAFIGTGGGGAGSGGSGGTGGIDYESKILQTEPHYYFINYGAGGGAGGGSMKALGGQSSGAHNTPDDMDTHSQDGDSFDGTLPESEIKNMYGKGGKGSTEDYPGVAEGADGGNGGSPGESAIAGKIMSTLNMTEQDNADYSKYIGKEASSYKVFSAYDCKIILKGSIEEGAYTYEATSQQITPDFDIIYAPTGEIIDKSAIDHVVWENNIEIGTNAKLTVYGGDFSSSHPTIGQSIIKAFGEVSVTFSIVNKGVNIDIKIAQQTSGYDGLPLSYEGSSFNITDVHGQPLGPEQITKDDFNFIILRYIDDEKRKTEQYDPNTPLYAGNYKMRTVVKAVKSHYFYSATTFDFSVSPKVVTIKDTIGSTIYVHKEYDGTCSRGELYGSPGIEGICDTDKSILQYTIEPQEYTTPDAHSKMQALDVYFNSNKKYLAESYVASSSQTFPYAIAKKDLYPTKIVLEPRLYDEDNYNIYVSEVTFSPIQTDFIRGEKWDATATITDNIPGEHEANVEVKSIDKNYTINGSITYKTTETAYIIGESGNVPFPKASSKTYVFNGEEQTYDVPGIDGVYSVSNNTATESDSYEVKYKLNNPDPENPQFRWEDGSTEDYVINWHIERAPAFDVTDQYVLFPSSGSCSLKYCVGSLDEQTQKFIPIKFPDYFNPYHYYWNYISEGSTSDFLYTIYSSFELDSEGHLWILTSLNDRKLNVGSKANYQIDISSNNYEDVKLNFSVELTNEPVIQIKGVNVSSKVYDGQPAQTSSDHIKLLYRQNGHECTESIYYIYDEYNFDYYNEDTSEQLDEVPVEPGKYYLIVSASPRDAYFGNVYAQSEKIRFSIDKKDAPSFTDKEIFVQKNDVTKHTVDMDIAYDEAEGDTANFEKGPSIIGEDYIDSWSITDDGHVEFTLSDKASTAEGQSVILNIIVSWDHYQSVDYHITIRIRGKISVTFSGLSFDESYTYNGEAITPDGTLKIEANGEDVTSQIPQEDVLFQYYNIVSGEEQAMDSAPIDVGTYKLKLSIADTNITYVGTCTFDSFSIKPKPFALSGTDTVKVERQFDGTSTINSGDLKGNITFKEGDIVSRDVGHVSLTCSTDVAFVDSNVTSYESYVYVSYSGDHMGNYLISQDVSSILVPYQILPKEIGFEKLAAIDRVYEKGKTDVELDIKFNNVVQGFDPEFTSSAYIDSANAGLHNVHYTITLEQRPEPNGNEDFGTKGDYCFENGVYEISDDDITVNIQKKDAIVLDSQNFEHQYDLADERNYPIDFTIPDEDYYTGFTTQLSGTEGQDIFAEKTVDYNADKGFCFNVQIDSSKSTEPGEAVIYTFTASTTNYADSLFQVKVITTQYTVVEPLGISIEEKTCDGSPAEESGELKIYDPNTQEYLNLDDFNIDRKYYKTDDPSKIFETSPVNAGSYVLKLSSLSKDNRNAEISYFGELEVPFTINKIGQYIFEDKSFNFPVTYSGVQVRDLDLSIPDLMIDGLTYSKAGQLTDKVITEWQVNSSGQLELTLATDIQVDDYNELTVKISSTNYEDSFVKVILTIVNREEVKISGLSFNPEGYQYNTKEVKPDGKINVEDKSGKDITSKFGDDDFVYTYYDVTHGSIEVDKAINVGTYKLEVKISESNLDYYGTKVFGEFIIYPKKISNLTNNCSVSKVFDGNISVPEASIKGTITSTDIFDKDIEGVIIYVPEFNTFTDVNVHSENITNTLSLDGGKANNYQLASSATSVDIPYEITPKEIAYNEESDVLATARPYKFDDVNVDVSGIEFIDVIPGFEPNYSTQGFLSSPDAGKEKDVSVKITLLENNQVNNYCFEDGELEVLIEDATTVDISKSSEVPSVISKEVQHKDEYGEFKFTFSEDDFPHGMIDGTQLFEMQSITDPSKIIDNLDIDSEKLQLTYKLNKFEEVDDHASVVINVNSNNYIDTTATLDIALLVHNIQPQPVPDDPGTIEYVTPSQTSDCISIFVISLLAAAAINLIFVVKRYRKRNNK